MGHMGVVSGTAVVVVEANASYTAHVPDSPLSASHLLTLLRLNMRIKHQDAELCGEINWGTQL